MAAKIFVLQIILCFVQLSGTAQESKPSSYFISKTQQYTIDVKANKPEVNLFAEQRIWVGDKNDNIVKVGRIGYLSAFEEISDIEAFSLSPNKKKEKVHDIKTADVAIENIFYHDQKFKYFAFSDLSEGSESYISYRKKFAMPQFLNSYYFRDDLDCLTSRIDLKVANKVAIGYILQGGDTNNISFSSRKEGNYTIYSWEMKLANKELAYAHAPGISYYSPHLIFFIKNYETDNGTVKMLGTVDDLYAFYFEMTKGINQTDETALKNYTDQITKGLSTAFEKATAIFNYVQSNVSYVAFEDGMGGFVPREAADVFQKKYGDCKDMANLLNQMLNHAGITSHIAWVGTRDKNYTYEAVPTPLVDNHMIVAATIDGKQYFLDATGQFTLFPNVTPFLQGKEALVKIDAQNYQLLKIPEVTAEKNCTNGSITFHFEGSKIVGNARFALDGFAKTTFLAQFRNQSEKKELLRYYLSQYIDHISTSNIEIDHNDLTQNALMVQNDFELEKWAKQIDDKLIFKPILFFPYADSRIDADKRQVPYYFDFKEFYSYQYEVEIPNGYTLSYKPADFSNQNELIVSEIKYTQNGNKLMVHQTMVMNQLLLAKKDFEAWNAAIKEITKQYNQNIILSKI